MLASPLLAMTTVDDVREYMRVHMMYKSKYRSTAGAKDGLIRDWIIDAYKTYIITEATWKKRKARDKADEILGTIQENCVDYINPHQSLQECAMGQINWFVWFDKLNGLKNLRYVHW